MALTAQELAILLKAKDEASAVLAGVDKSLGKTDDNVKKVSSSWNAAGAIARAAAGVISGVLAGALADAARAAAADAASVASLQQAIENTGASWEDSLPIIEARIGAGQRLAFADDQTRASLQILTEATGSVTTALGVQSLAMDISRARHISLEAASTIVGKVVTGNTAVLKKFGVTLAEGATATEAMAALQAKFGGQAEKYGRTTSASIDRIKDAIDEWKEGIGASLGPAQTFVALLPGLSSGMAIFGGTLTALGIPALKDLKGGLKGVIPAIGGALLAILPVIIAIGALAAAALFVKTAWEKNWGDIQGTVEAARYAVTAILRKLGEALGWVGDRAGEVAEMFGNAFGWIMDRARDIFNMLPGFIRERLGDLGQFGQQFVGNFSRGVAREIPAFMDNVRGFIGDAQDTISEVVSGMKVVGGEMLEGLGAGMESMSGWLADKLNGVGKMIPADLKGGIGDIEGIGLQIPTDLAAGITKGGAAAKAAAEKVATDVSEAFKALVAQMRTDAVNVAIHFGQAVAPMATEAQKIAIGTSILLKQQPGTFGGISGAQARSGPSNILTLPSGLMIPMFAQGGIMPWTGLAHLEKGEPVGRAAGGLTINFNAPVYGLQDFADQVRRIVRDTQASGGFRGVIPSVIS